MLYKFGGIYNNDMYNTCNVMIIGGEYQLFNNLVSDKLKSIATPKFEGSVDLDLVSEFTVSISDTVSNVVSFDEFMKVKSSYPMVGRWFCSINYSFLTEKQRSVLKEYIKQNTDTGILVVYCDNYKFYREFTKNRALQASKTAHFIQLSYPNRQVLKTIVVDLLALYSGNKNIKVSDKAVELFIMRLGSDYNSYSSILQTIAVDYRDKYIGYDDILQYIQNIDNYNIDEFIERLVKTKINDKFVKTRKVYKAYYSIVDDIGAENFLRKLEYKIKALVEMRVYINNGKVPVLVKYGAKEVQDSLPDNSQLKKLSTFSFKRLAKLASETSLRDWSYILMLIKSSKYGKFKTEEQCENIIHSIIHRYTFSSERLNNDMDITDTVSSSLYALNRVQYTDSTRKSAEFDWDSYARSGLKKKTAVISGLKNKTAVRCVKKKKYLSSNIKSSMLISSLKRLQDE